MEKEELRKDLVIVNHNSEQINIIDSRKVSEMMGKTYLEILQYLDGLKDKNDKIKIVGIMPTITPKGRETFRLLLQVNN